MSSIRPAHSFALLAAGALALCGTTTKRDQARVDLRALENRLDLFRLEAGRYPNAAEGLDTLASAPGRGPICKVPRDPWHRAYPYQPPSRPDGASRIWSTGPDGIDGSEDDVTRTRGLLFGCGTAR